ncbi:hypothetical protein PAMP_010272 [Pampus punctatissimus]
METQRNRQKNGQSPSTMGKNRDREKERGVMVGGAVPADSHLKDITGPSTSSLAPTPPSQSSSTDSSSPHSPQLSPQFSPSSQLSDLTSDGPPVESCSPGPSSAPHPDPQGSVTGGEVKMLEEVVKVEEAKEAKSNKKQHLHCPTCKVTVNSSSQLEAHCSGSKHKQMLDGQNSSQSQRRAKMMSLPRPACRIKQRMGSKTRAVVGVSSQPFHCELCQVSVNSETQLKQTKLALQKQLSKALPAGFLTSPLNPAALCTMTSGPLTLRLPQGPTAIIQGPLISPTLFRPAPGPLRATHAPIIFSPY